MIEQLSDLPDGTIGFQFTGQVTTEDYSQVLTPAVEKAIAEFDRVKFLGQFGPGFDGYTLGAAWNDAKVGLRHWSGFERIAIVSDVEWLATAASAAGAIMPCPVEIFELCQLDEAKRWLSESLGAIHVQQGDNHTVVRLLGQLEPAAYASVDSDIDDVMSRQDDVHLVLDLREFSGWTGLSAIGNHLSLIRDHRRVPQRVAVVGNQAWQRMAEKLVSQFIAADTRFFESHNYADAEAWAGS